MTGTDSTCGSAPCFRSIRATVRPTPPYNLELRSRSAFSAGMATISSRLPTRTRHSRFSLTLGSRGSRLHQLVPLLQPAGQTLTVGRALGRHFSGIRHPLLVQLLLILLRIHRTPEATVSIGA